MSYKAEVPNKTNTSDTLTFDKLVKDRDNTSTVSKKTKMVDVVSRGYNNQVRRKL